MNQLDDEKAINVISLVKETPGSRYVFLYEDVRRTELLRTFGRFAGNPELDFSWYDASVLSDRVRQGG